MGNGPFKLKSWKPNQKIIVEKNPLYWDVDTVQLNEIHFYPIESAETEERMFRTGQLHRTNTVPLSKLDVYRRDNPDLLRIEPLLSVYFYRCNVTRPPFDDRAGAPGLRPGHRPGQPGDQRAAGGQLPAYNFTPQGFPDYQPNVRLEGDLEDARRLMAEAGFPGGEGMPTIDILYNTSESHRTIAEALQQMWRTNLGVMSN